MTNQAITRGGIIAAGEGSRLRADGLGAFGYRRALTPNIDALGEQGVLFRNCYVP